MTAILIFKCTEGAGVGDYSSREGLVPNRSRPLTSFDTHARWQPVTQSARSRRSYGKIEDCEQSAGKYVPRGERDVIRSRNPTEDSFRQMLTSADPALVACAKIRPPCTLKQRVQQEYNSLLVNALNRIFKSNLSLNHFKWLLTQLELWCVRNIIPRCRKRL